MRLCVFHSLSASIHFSDLVAIFAVLISVYLLLLLFILLCFLMKGRLVIQISSTFTLTTISSLLKSLFSIYITLLILFMISFLPSNFHLLPFCEMLKFLKILCLIFFYSSPGYQLPSAH